MPLNPSIYLQTHLTRLISISRPAPTHQNPKARELSFQKRAEFCLQHHHEITTIPLGRRAGFPDVIDFVSVIGRISGRDGWLGRGLRGLLKDPEGFRSWQDVVGIMKKGGFGRSGGANDGLEKFMRAG